MKKRILSLLCSLALLAAMIPVGALADDMGMDVTYSTFEEFKTAVESATATPVRLSDCEFEWPETQQTLEVKRPIQVDVGTETSYSWTIPQNISLVFSGQGKIQTYANFNASLTIRGTVTCPTYTSMPEFRLFDAQGEQNTLTIASGAKVNGGFYIPDNLTCIVESGAEVSLDSTVMLGGTLKGSGGQIGKVDINTTYSAWNGQNRAAELSGEITLKSLNVSYTEQQDLPYELSIPSGSSVHVTGQFSMEEWTNRVSRLSLNGTLALEKGYHQVGGEIMLGSGGVLQLNPGATVEAYNNEYSGQIIGNGTIKAYTEANGYSGMPMLWDYTSIGQIVPNRESYADLVATTVNIWCSWDSSCEHDWQETSRTEATCTETGKIFYTCSKCGETKTETVKALGHELTYSASGSTITQTCQRDGCGHTATATLSAFNETYTGSPITASINYDKNWWGALPSLRYDGSNVNAGSVTVYATANDTAVIYTTYTINRATDYTVSLGNLSQYSDSVSAVTWTTKPLDSTATATVEYQVTIPEKPCTHVHDESCGANGESCTHEHNADCGYEAAKTEWTTALPTAVGSYPVRVKLTGSENLALKADEGYTTGTLTISARSSGGGSGGSGNKTETTTNPDGSTTTTVTRPDGSTTETTKNPDGSSEVVDTKKDGTVTTTTTDKDGNKTVVTENIDGTTETIVTNTNGTSSTTKMDADGKTETVVKLPSSIVADAADKGETVALSMPEVTATSDSADAPTVTVDLSGSKSAKVEIPVAGVTPGTVAVIVGEDGDEQIIMNTIPTENGVAVTLADGDTVKIIDNSKDFADVPDSYWGADAVDFATSRELFNGTSETAFTPEGDMTRAMIVTVLARYEGVDTSTGDTWYDAGRDWAMEAGISDGSDMDGTLTREQLATMLYRYAGEPAVSGDMSGFADSAAVSDYAANAMTWAVKKGIITGMGDSSLAPQGQATRAQVATMLMRFIEDIA